MAQRTDELIVCNLVKLQPTNTLLLLGGSQRSECFCRSKYGVFVLISF